VRAKEHSVKYLALATVSLTLAASAVEVASESIRVVLDEKAHGVVRRIVSADGVELAATRGQLPLFLLKVTRVDDYSKSVDVEPGENASCAVTCREGGVELVYTGLGEAVVKVVCTVRPDGRKLRWNIAAVPKTGWAIEQTAYPRLLTAERIGTTGRDDAVVAGNAKGGVKRNPADGNCHVGGRMPGSLACQFACHYDDSALFYYAAEDGRGYAKLLNVDSHPSGVAFKFTHVGFDDKAFRLPYDIVTACIDGTNAKPTTWFDAADLYRTWARKQNWCGKPLRDRDDLPKWMRDAPAMVRFGREWLDNPDRIRTWMKNYWQTFYVKAPLVTAFWGWEKHGSWVSDYFPVHPSDAAFAALVKDLKSWNAHAFPWPSGYYWILDYNRGTDGRFEFTDYANYEAANGDAFCCVNRDGKPYRRTPGWLNGGSSTCLCGGTAFCRDWWNKTVCLPLARLGCELIQADQTVGGAFPPCWSRTHGHAPGDGLWKRDVFYRQLSTMRETMRTVEPDSVVCFEEPCELYNDLLGIQDYRSCEACSDEWASVFNYVYHEFLPCFQSNPRRTDRFWKAHEAADGQIPHLTPGWSDLQGERPAIEHGGFESVAKSGTGFVGWECLKGYNGAVWKGRAFVDREMKYDGSASLRLECARDETNVQVSQNVPVDGMCFRVGGRYRLSAWLKTGKGNGNRIGCCFLGVGARAIGRVDELRFPKAEEGWKLVSTDFTVAEGASCLRIMNDAKEESVVWIDAMKLEELGPDGSAREVILSGRVPYDAFMRNWVSVYHGCGRDWLAHGRQIRPPVLDCETVPFKMTLYGGVKFEGFRPAVFHSAWESLDGRRALVFVNATAESQLVAYRWNGEAKRLWVKPDEVMLVEVKK